MEPADDQSGATGQTSPFRGNDWEVVHLTASNYASAPPPAPARSEHPDEDSAGQVYGTNGGDDPTLLVSGHFSVHRNDQAQSQGAGSSSAERRQEARGSEYAVSDHHRQGKLKEEEDDLGKGKSLSTTLAVGSDDVNALRGAAEDPVVRFSSAGDGAREEADKEESSKTEMKAEEPVLQNLDPVAGSSEVEESRPDGSGSGVPRNAWLRKQMISLYRSARESNKFWPVILAGAALMGMAFFRRRWLRGKLQLQQVQLQPAGSKERINHAVPPLNRIKDILVAGNHPSPGPHGHARLS